MELSLINLFGVFISGLALNLTPCVYPMLSVTVALFGGQKSKRPAEIFLKALLFVLGLCVIYSALGVSAALTGKLFGSFFQTPFALTLIAIVMFVLAAGMFGAYEFQIPSSWLNHASSFKYLGLTGIFLSGAFVGLFAAPCVGPPIIALLAVVGQEGDAWKGFLVFFVLSMGLGLPYLILGTFSGLLNRLPRSGEWMIWVKKIFGITLLGVAAFYLCVAWVPSLLSLVVPVVIAGGAFYLAFVEESGNSNKIFRRTKYSLGTAGIIVALVIFLIGPTKKVEWESYSPEAAVAAMKEGKPVVLDFYADWCISCHELERFTYSDPKVIEALQPFHRLKVDLTNPEKPEANAMIEKYQVFGIPTVVFLGPDGRELKTARVEGFVSASEFRRLVHSVIASLSGGTQEKLKD